MTGVTDSLNGKPIPTKEFGSTGVFILGHVLVNKLNSAKPMFNASIRQIVSPNALVTHNRAPSGNRFFIKRVRIFWNRS